MSEPKPIYRTNGKWMALVFQGNLFDTMGEWAGWLDNGDVYGIDGEYLGYLSGDGRLLRPRVMPYHKRRRPPDLRPRVKIPQTVALPPMFAELRYSTVDVFEEKPDIFAVINELRPDAGEKPLVRLVETDPRMAVQEKLRGIEHDVLEEMVDRMVYTYGIGEPPVPIEAMAAGLQSKNAGQVETARPPERLRMAEEMIELLGRSAWATERGYCGPEGFSRTQIHYAARSLLMPRDWILKMPRELRLPAPIARLYVVPEETATLRLHDLESHSDG